MIIFLYANIKKNLLDSFYVNDEIKGTIVAINKKRYDYTTCIIKPDKLFSPKIYVKVFEAECLIFPGQVVKIKGLFLKGEPLRNLGGYDEEKYFYSNNIGGKIYVYNKDFIELDESNWRNIPGKLYIDIKNSCKLLLGNEIGNIMAGMLIGAKEEIDDITISNFQKSGLSHTMAVSGSHVSYILVPLLFLFSKLGLKRRSYYPLIILVLFFFCILTCLKPSVIRATITAVVFLVSKILYESTDSITSLSFSAIILILINPFCIFDAGFILSYSCVVSIILFYNPLVSFFKRNKIIGVILLTLAVQLGVTLISAKIFYTYNTYSFIANLVVIPIRGVMTIVGWIMYLLYKIWQPLGIIVSFIAKPCVQFVFFIANFFSDLKYSAIPIKSISPYILLIYYFGLNSFLNSKSKKIFIYTALLIITLSTINGIKNREMKVIFIDVGQGDSTLISNNNTDILIDTGKYANRNAISYFTGYKIDYIFITHSDLDHIGGLMDILETFNVKNLVIPDVNDDGFNKYLDYCEEKQINVIKANNKYSFIIEECKINVFNPYKTEYDSLNNTSLVLKLIYKDFSVLFTGDAEVDIEKYLVENDVDLKSDIYQVGHHGAKTSSSKEFVECVNPAISIISVGYNNYGHPTEEVMEKLDYYYRTDISGEIIIYPKKNGIEIGTIKK